MSCLQALLTRALLFLVAIRAGSAHPGLVGGALYPLPFGKSKGLPHQVGSLKRPEMVPHPPTSHLDPSAKCSAAKASCAPTSPLRSAADPHSGKHQGPRYDIERSSTSTEGSWLLRKGEGNMNHGPGLSSQASHGDKSESRKGHSSHFLGSHSSFERDPHAGQHAQSQDLLSHAASGRPMRESSAASDHSEPRRQHNKGEPSRPHQEKFTGRHFPRAKHHVGEKEHLPQPSDVTQKFPRKDRAPGFYEVLLSGEQRRRAHRLARASSKTKKAFQKVHKVIIQNPRESNRKRTLDRLTQREMDSMMTALPGWRRQLVHLGKKNPGYPRMYAKLLDSVVSRRAQSRIAMRAYPRTPKGREARRTELRPIYRGEIRLMQNIMLIDRHHNPNALSTHWKDHVKRPVPGDWSTAYWEQEIAKRREQMKRLGMQKPFDIFLLTPLTVLR